MIDIWQRMRLIEESAEGESDNGALSALRQAVQELLNGLNPDPKKNTQVRAALRKLLAALGDPESFKRYLAEKRQAR